MGVEGPPRHRYRIGIGQTHLFLPARFASKRGRLAVRTALKISSQRHWERRQGGLVRAGGPAPQPLRELLNSADGRLIRLLARSAFLLNPGDGFDGMPLDSPLRLDPLEDPMPAEPSDRRMYVAATLQTQVLSDLLVIHTACNQILARRKSLDNMHDFDDMQRFAADLLLARCPDICRHRYPPEDAALIPQR